MDLALYDGIRDYLRDKHPALFIKGSIKLLKVGIHNCIVKAESFRFSKRNLRKYLSLYIKKKVYREMHKEGAIRYYLDGNEAGIVTKENAESKSSKMPAKKEGK